VTQASTYLVIRRRTELRTSPEYVRHIIAGLRQNHAPADYLDYVKTKAIESVPEARAAIAAI
jgi:hypothetical protein